jgi:hypothetical protein
LPGFADAQGNEIPEDQLADAFARGEAFGDAEAQYSMRNAVGDVVQVKGAEVPKALAAGASLLSPTESAFEARRGEYEGTGAALRTMAERGVSTATGGLSDLAVGLAAPEATRGMRERAMVQKDAGELGSLIGMAAPFSLAGKLAKPVSKLAALAKPTTPIGRMALRAASEAAPYALEGALYGATSTAGNLALNQQEITAEKVLSGAGQGALLGGLFGLGSQAAALGARKIAGKLDDVAEGLAKRNAKTEGRAIDALKPSARLIKSKVGRDASRIESALDDVNRDYLGYVIKTGPMKGKQIHHGARDPVDVIDDVTHAWNETGREIQRFRDAADELGRAAPEARPDAVALNRKLDDVVAEVAGDEFAGAAQKKARAEDRTRPPEAASRVARAWGVGSNRAVAGARGGEHELPQDWNARSVRRAQSVRGRDAAASRSHRARGGARRRSRPALDGAKPREAATDRDRNRARRNPAHRRPTPDDRGARGGRRKHPRQGARL